MTGKPHHHRMWTVIAASIVCGAIAHVGSSTAIFAATLEARPARTVASPPIVSPHTPKIFDRINGAI